MSSALAKPSIEGLERVLIDGDLGGLNPDQRVMYYRRVCESVGLNELTQPFQYLRLNGKTLLYATRACTDQLRRIHSVSVTIVSREKTEGIYVVTARASTPDGRCDESIGAVPLDGLKGENLANALMKAETKAKRRVTLAICGLSVMDETEVASVPGAQMIRAEPPKALAADAPVEPEHDEHGEVVDDDAHPDPIGELVDVLLQDANSHDALVDWARALVRARGSRDDKRVAWQAFGAHCAALELHPSEIAAEARK